MRCSTISLLSVFLLGALFAQSPQNFNLDPYNPEYDPHTILIKFKDETQLNNSFAKSNTQSGIAAIDGIMRKYDVTEVKNVFKNAKPYLAKRTFVDPNGEEHTVPNLDKIYKIKYEADIDPKDLVEELKQEPSLDYAEPDYYVYMALAPDDPFYQSGDQWHIDAVNAPAAWDSTTSDTSQLIAIIDTGVDWDHPDLDDNIWINRAEYTGIPGVDDDNNGYVDDIRGWDFINDNNDPNDDNSHGTHVAGIAAAESNNGVGITGIAWNARIMPIKMLQSSGRGSSSDLASAINYAYQNGSTVINMSLGSYGESLTVKDVLYNAYVHSVLVAAAGNDGLPLVEEGIPSGNMYPACYPFVLGVQCKGGFSNVDPSGPIDYWNRWTNNYELTAPGVNIYSTFPNGTYRSLSGTSMATPIVSGICALAKSYNDISTDSLWAKLIFGSENGYVNAFNTLNYDLLAKGPDLRFVEYVLLDTLPGCDNDGRADAGETIEIYFKVRNVGGYADSVWSKLYFSEFEDTTTAQIIDSTSVIGNLSTWASLTGELDHILVHISEDVGHNRDICFKYDIMPRNGENKITGDLVINVERGIELSGVLTHDDTLHAKYLYLVNESYRIGTEAILYIEPGTEIQIYSGKDIDVRGKVLALGTKDSMIWIHSKDDYGGSGFIHNYGGSNSVFSFCKFTNLGKPLDGDGGQGGGGIELIEHCIFEQCGYPDDISIFRNNVVRNSSGRLLYRTSIVEYNNFYNWGSGDSWYYLPTSTMNYNNFIGDNITVGITSGNWSNCGNSFIGINNGAISVSGSADVLNLPNQYWGSTRNEEINRIVTDFWDSNNLPEANTSPILNRPSSINHGHVWKVEINGIDPFDETLDPIGVETLKFDVYFNRAMDTSYTPLVGFGVNEPYLQRVVTDRATWSTDSTIWTAYFNVNPKTGDGIQTIHVRNGYDNEGFELPPEKYRFKFVIQAASAASIDFMAEAGIGKVDLEWPSAETDDILGYNMYRALRINYSTYSDYSMINTSLVTDTTYTDFNVIPDSTYKYQYTIIGTDMAESDPSKEIISRPFSAANGDANGDMNVNILDIISIVSYMLEDDPAPFLFDAADLNGDDVINVLDIIGVISIIINDGMGKQAYADATESIFSVKDKKIMASSNGTIGGYQFMINGDIKDLNISSEYPMEVVTHNVADDKMLVMVYSLTGNVIPEGNHSILNLSTTKDITFSDLVVADSKGHSVSSQFGDGGALIPEEFKLEQNYPNPFNATTTIAYQLPKASDVSLKVYNLLGQTVYTQQITDQRPGYYHYTWQGMDNTGHVLPSGLYIYRITASDFTDSKKMILLK